MSIFQRIFRRNKEKRSGTYNPAQWLIDWVSGGSATSSGVHVNERTALQYTPFWASVRVISGTLAALPFIVYRRLDAGKERINDHPVYTLLHDRPNEYIDSITFIETLQTHVLTYGNGYAEIQRDGAGRPVALWPLLPDRTFRKISQGGIPYYEVHMSEGGTVNLPDYNVLHIKGLGFDGYTGYNVVSYHKEAIGYGIAVKEYGHRFFGNNASIGGILEHPNTLSDAAAKRLEESWNKTEAGLSKAHRTKVLEEGMKWTKVGVEPEQAQALEVQKYTVDDCSRIFNIPPHKIGSLERATFSNIEEQNIDFVTQTMFYWFRKWEQECNYKLILPANRRTIFCEILVDGLLRGDTKSRYEAYNIGRNGGWLSADDIRGMENMNPLPDGKGKIYLEPLNMKEAGTEPEPTPPPEPDSDDVRQAHFDLIKSQVDRVIGKQKNTGKIQRDYAKTILTQPAIAFGSLSGVTRDIALGSLDDVIFKSLNLDSDSEHITDAIMTKIQGVDNVN